MLIGLHALDYNDQTGGGRVAEAKEEKTVDSRATRDVSTLMAIFFKPTEDENKATR